MSSDKPLTITLPKWPDMHAHFRQGPALAVFVREHLKMGCDIVLAMPNTKPPVSKVFGPDSGAAWSIEGYKHMIAEAGGRFRELIVPLYITAAITPSMIDEGARRGVLRAVKYYPPHGTTNSEFGVPLEKLLGGDVFRALERNGVVLCIHGEQHALGPEKYFDRDSNAESLFYLEQMPALRDAHPGLRISCEHITTKAAAHFVQESGSNIAATVTPQHLLFTVGHLLQGWLSDLRCMPLVKFEPDRLAIVEAVTGDNNSKFIAGTDSAPHPRIAKSTPCGCASGCYTGGIAPQLYAQAFEAAGLDLANEPAQRIFRRFLAENAWAFWNFAPSNETFRLTKTQTENGMVILPDGQEVAPLSVGMTGDANRKSATLNWAIQ